MYHCEKCDKYFEKRQAYIGHCSSHNRTESYKKGRRKKPEKSSSLKCDYCGTSFDSFKKMGGHKGSCKLNPNYVNRNEKLSNIAKNRTFSEDVKDKISKSMKSYFDANPGKIPYLLNHSSKESFPERIFREKLESEGISGWIQEYPFLRYSLDFAFIDYKLDVEIDGGTHNTEKVRNKDLIRDKNLERFGWKVFRISAKCLINNIDHEFDKIKEILSNVERTR